MKKMSRRILLGSFRRRRGRAVISIGAVALGVSLIVAGVNLSRGIRGRLAEELRNYGSNLLLVPRAGAGAYLKEKEIDVLEDKSVQGRLMGYAPFLYSLVKIQGKNIVAAGTEFPAVQKISPWWQVEGKWPEVEDEALVGSNLASKFGLRLGDRVTVAYRTSELAFSVTGILRTGGSEEHQIFISLKSAQLLTGLRGRVTSVLVSSRAGEDLDRAVDLLRQALPDAEIRTLLQVATAEKTLLSRLETFLVLVGLIVLVASGLSVYSTTATAALERKVELALMRALGAEEKRVTRIFTSEIAAVGMVGGLIGCIIGLVLTEVISVSVFRAFVLPSFLSLPIGLGVGLGVSLLSSLALAKKVAKVSPAIVLRGE